MAEYRHSAHAIYDIKYHVIWITKYRYKILRGRIAERARDLIRQICQAREVVIVRGAVSTGSYPYVAVGAVALDAGEGSAVREGEVVATVAGGVSGLAEAVLGTAPVGAGVF